MNAIVLLGDPRALPLPDASVDLIVTSPAYWKQRDYGFPEQLGLEATPQEWVANLIDCTREWMRVLKPVGNMFVNLGDKMVDKALLGLPWRYALAATDQLGLILRRDIIWAKPNGLPESVTDRCRSSHEYVFHLVKQPRYYAAVDEIREPHTGTAHAFGKNGAMEAHGVNSRKTEHARSGITERYLNPLGKLPGSVWSIPSQPLQVPAHLGVDHFAAFPMELPRRCVLGWSPPGICTRCGEGRRPVTQLGRTAAFGNLGNGGKRDARRDDGQRGTHDFFSRATERFNRTATITGYACACTPCTDHPGTGESSGEGHSRPAVVLDPFGGTGTTALVASMHGRTGVSVDRSAGYTRLARWRTTDPGERAKAAGVPKPPPVPDGMEALF